MQGTIAQTLGLALHANAFLQKRNLGTFWPDATFFQFCRSVRFLDCGPGGGPEMEIAADPAAWLRTLRARCRGVRVHASAGNGDAMTVGFIGGGSLWRIEEVGGERPFRWWGDWSVPPRDADEERIWSVVYRGVAIGAGHGPAPTPELEPAERQLAVALEAIAAFAERIRSDFSQSFYQALDCLAGRADRAPPYYPDLAPPEFLSPDARRILTACQLAWVFGGMGSWNDEDRGEEGNRLTETLLGRIQTALAAAVNSTAPPIRAAFSPSPTSPSGR